MYNYLKNFGLISILFLIYSCQLNDTLSVIKENIMMGKNEEDFLIVDKTKRVIKDKREKLSKEEIKKNNKRALEENFDKKDKVEIVDFELSKKKKAKVINDDVIALVQPKIFEEDFQFIQSKQFKEVGLLFPMSGKDYKLGESLISSVRLYLKEKNSNLKFKVFDTGSSLEGSLKAIKKGFSNNLEVFIGPIFSDQTRFIQKYANQNQLLILSLSTDKRVISDNVITVGINLEDEVFCMLKNGINNGTKKIGVVSNDDDYGNLLQETLDRMVENNFSENENLTVSHLKISKTTDIDSKIKEFSFFEEGKLNLTREIERVVGLNINQELKEKMVNELEQKETFGNKPYDLLIVSESGSKLIEIIALFAFYDIDSSNTSIVGTSVWEGIEKFKENILDNTYYASSLKTNRDYYKEKFYSIFYRKPNKLNFIVNDLLGFLESQSAESVLTIKKNNFYEGPYSTSKVSEEGYLKRSIFLNKINKEKVQTIYSCPVLRM